ncbi:BTAD domain-containing putative transcriptional regulator [soil metagenome]
MARSLLDHRPTAAPTWEAAPVTGGAAARLRVFGGVEAIGPDGPVDLGGPKQRAVLAVLLVEPGTVVSLDRLIDVIWGDDAPARAEVSVRGYVSNLRRALGAVGFDPDAVLRFRERGYVLQVAPEQIDIHRFEAGVRRGAAAARTAAWVEARTELDEALGLWAGPPFGAAADELHLGEVVARLDQRHGEEVEERDEARLALGEHAEATTEVLAAVAQHPYRERLRHHLALALYRSGRPVEALRALADARATLADIGVDPGPELATLEAAVLRHDPELAWVAAPVAPVRAPTVTVRPEPPLFGRDEEAASVRAAVDRLPDGGSVVVEGEAGIGKTAPLEVLRSRAEAEGRPVGWGRCPESAAAAPYRSWDAAVRQLVAGGAMGLAGATAGGRGGDLGDPVGARLATHLAVADVLRSAATPAVVVIDDLQWADDATLALLEFLAGELDGLPLLLGVTVRRSSPGEVSDAVRDCLAELARGRRAVHLALGGLAEAAVTEWVAAATGDRPAEGMAELLSRTTDGNPFYVRELLALLESEGSLDRAGPLTAVPAAVQDVVRRRTSRLPPESQAVLATAAVVGRRFDLDLLAAVLDLDRAEALDLLGPAIDSGIVVPDEAIGRFAFSHALVAETLVAEQHPVRLAKLHARTAVALEDLRADRLDAWVEELAHHATAGTAAGIEGIAGRAVRWSLAAADVARRSQASGDEADHVERALAAMALEGGQGPDRRVELLVRLGVARRDAGDVFRGRVALVDAALLAESIGDDAAVAAALDALNPDDIWTAMDWSLHDPRAVALLERALDRVGEAPTAARARLGSSLAAELVYLDPARADEQSARALAAAEVVGDPLLVARTVLHRYWGLSGPTHNGERIELTGRLIALADSGVLPDHLVPLAHLSRVAAAYEVGDLATVEACRRRARETAHPVRTPTAWAHLQYLETSLALLVGDLDRAATMATAIGGAYWRVRRFSADATRASLLAVIRAEQGRTDDALANVDLLEAPPYGTSIQWLRAWVLAGAGRLDEVGPALAAFDGPLGEDWYRVPLTAAAVQAAAAAGEIGFLRRHLPDLVPLADRFACLGGGGIVFGPVAQALAVGSEALGDLDAARVHAATARAMAEGLESPPWVARAQAVLARLGR